MAGKKLPIEVSVKGVAAYTHLYVPDTKFAKPGEDGKYKLSLVVDKNDLADLKARIEGGSEVIGGVEWMERIMNAHERADGDKANSPVKDGDKPVDKRGKAKDVNEEFAGTWIFNFKTTYPPQLVDSKKNDLPKVVKIMSGDVVKVSLRPNVFDGGVNLYMNAVMLIEKNAGGGGAGAFGDDEEGYVADKSAANDACGRADVNEADSSSNGEY